MKNGGSFHSYVSLPEGNYGNYGNSCEFHIPGISGRGEAPNHHCFNKNLRGIQIMTGGCVFGVPHKRQNGKLQSKK